MDIRKLVIFALVAEFLSGKAALDDPQPLKGPPEPFVEWDAKDAEFFSGRTDADRQIHPAIRDVVEDRDLLGDPHWVVERQKQYIGANANPLRASRDRRQKGDRRRVPRIRREMVLAGPDIVKAQLFGQHCLFEMLSVELLQRPRFA